MNAFQPRSRWLAARMALWVVALQGFVRFVPLPRVVRLVEPRTRTSSLHERDVQRIVALAQTMTSWVTRQPERMCLVRSLVAYRYLARAGLDPEFHVGFRRGEGLLVGHAWVEVNGAPVTDRPDAIATLTTTMAFVPLAR